MNPGLSWIWGFREPGAGVSTADSDRPWLAEQTRRRDALAGLCAQGRLDQLTLWAQAASIRTASGHTLRFVDQSRLPPGQAYEAFIYETGQVPTRAEGEGAVHDLYNALMWLRWPLSKAALNALHVRALRAESVDCRTSDDSLDRVGSRRGALRDRLTLFDESGLVWVCADESINEALRGFRWHELFVARRASLQTALTARVFGHAILQKLERPYKAITAHALILPLSRTESTMDLDVQLAGLLAQEWPGLCPLPVLGLPGWSPENQDPGFYADPKIFRPGRIRHLQSPLERVGRSLRVPAPGEEGPDSGGQGAG